MLRDEYAMLNLEQRSWIWDEMEQNGQNGIELEMTAYYWKDKIYGFDSFCLETEPRTK